MNKKPSKSFNPKRLYSFFQSNNANDAKIQLICQNRILILFYNTKQNIIYIKNCGKILPSGLIKFKHDITSNEKIAILQSLEFLTNHPEIAAKQFADITKKCCFCNRKLTNPKSIKYGYGQICAEHFNLQY